MVSICPITIPLEVKCSFRRLGEKTGYIRNLQKNLEDLENTTEKLLFKRETLLRRLEREEAKGLEIVAEFQVWLNKVQTIENESRDLLLAKDDQIQRLCICGLWSKSLISSYNYGKNVFSTLRKAEKLSSEGFEVIADQLYQVEEIQLPSAIVGQKRLLDKAWKHLMEEGVGIIGMYGMGGVGKTTLLAQINNKFSNDMRGYNYVIWVVVSKDLQIVKIQDRIAQQIGLGGDEWNKKSKSDKTEVLLKFLKKKKFVLFLDDLWKKVDLADIGVPRPTKKNECKVAFTTRIRDVCGHMDVVNPMKVQFLTDNEAYYLFEEKVGKDTIESDPDIPDLARQVAKKCGGLPLALNVIGRAMACKTTAQEWRDAIDVLKFDAAQFSGMEDEILSLLKYSYDNLKDEKLELCLLYCALFPEDTRIQKKDLIEYWACEGIIDGIKKAENKSYDIIGKLVRASLLMEEVNKDDIEMVYMHDVVREMALWIVKEAFIVHPGAGINGMLEAKEWSIVRRMSLIDNEIVHLDDGPKCMELTTLFLQRTSLTNISSEFFKSMPKLVVLDLSQNRKLFELPDQMSELVSLQYLNLSGTPISYISKGLQKLENLIHLDLEDTRLLSSIVGISNLDNLKVLKLLGSCFSCDLKTVEELESLKHLEILTTSIGRSQSPEIFFSSRRLTLCTRYLTIWRNRNLESSGLSLPVTMDKLCNFEVKDCSYSEIKMRMICSLVDVRIHNCESLREMTFLMFAPNLRRLTVTNAEKLEDIINEEEAFEGEDSKIVPFPKLIDLRLTGLPQLKNIYCSPLDFPYLKRMDIFACPNLKKLPLHSTSGKQGENKLIIRHGPEIWIQSVEWEDEATKTRFST